MLGFVVGSSAEIPPSSTPSEPRLKAPEESRLVSGHGRKCLECPYKSLTLADYTRHVQGHSRKASFKCDLCSYSADASRSVISHSKVHKLGSVVLAKPDGKWVSRRILAHNCSTPVGPGREFASWKNC